jgi:glucokinase
VSILAVDIGGTKLAMAIFQDGKIVQRHYAPTHRAGGPTWMLGEIARQAREWMNAQTFTACGIGFGGTVNFPAQRVDQSAHVEGWADFPLAAHFERELNLPTIFDNDANLGALGEAEFGAGQGARPMLYVTASTGIGGGIVLDNGIYRGADSNAGEIGHTPVRADGPPCPCGGVGCLERVCGGMAMEKDHGKSAKELLADPAFMAKYVVDFARGLKIATMLLNPAKIVIGGGITNAGDALFVPLRRELRKQIPASAACRIDVVRAALGQDSVLFGAAALTKEIQR